MDHRYEILVIVTPNFNIMTTVGFLDPLRAANYLDGAARFHWIFASSNGGSVIASNGLSVDTRPLAEIAAGSFDIVIVSSSWAPEAHAVSPLLVALRGWARSGALIGALDTGAFILAKAGLLKGKAATVHYEHIDAIQELHEDVRITEDLFVLGENQFTCCGGTSSIDVALHILRDRCGDALANAAARYVFHPAIRPPGSPQNPALIEPLGRSAPPVLRQIIVEMEKNLDDPLPVPELCRRANLSQRQVIRLFDRYVGKSPALYYRDIRLDRARGLVTQTDLQLSQVAVATGFSSQAHFSKAYKERFGISARSDRSVGRIPFEFRAWPMHSKGPRPTD